MTFLLAAAILLYIYPFVVYPAIMKLWPARRRPLAPPLPQPPSVAMVICALNEEQIIRQKLENCFLLEYPESRLTIYLVNDGSTDRTAAIAREFCPRGLQLIDRPQRRGKVANLNEVVATLTQEIVLLSDANVIYDLKAVSNLVARFADPTVGCVTGRVILVDSTDDIRAPEQRYYSLEWLLMERASGIYSMCGVDGAMYAFRRGLFEAFPDDTLIEDFVHGISIVGRGYRVVFEGSANAWEEGPKTLREEFRRKVRIAAGAAQALLRRNGVPRNAPPSFWFIWISHKFLRWVSPVVGLCVLLIAAMSCGNLFSQIVLIGFAVLLAASAFRWITGVSTLLLNAPFYFTFGQVAVALGLCKGFLGTQSVLWEKANR